MRVVQREGGFRARDGGRGRLEDQVRERRVRCTMPYILAWRNKLVELAGDSGISDSVVRMLRELLELKRLLCLSSQRQVEFLWAQLLFENTSQLHHSPYSG